MARKSRLFDEWWCAAAIVTPAIAQMRMIILLATMTIASGCLPDSANALNHASELYTHGRYQDAAHEYQRAIDMDPSWAPPYLGLGNSLWALNQRAEALQAYRRAAELRPGWVEAQVGLGSALLDLDRPDEAVPVLTHALDLDPNDLSVKSLLDKARARAVRKRP